MPVTAAMPSVAHCVVPCAKRALGYAETLLKDIPAARFAHMPHPTMNHPAFCIGHLSLYPNKLFGLIGQPNKVVEKKGYDDLFKSGTACVEQDGRYPHKDEIVAHFMERYHAIINAIATTPDEIFARENPLEGRMKEIFPQVGIAVNFMLNNHVMMHLGQISAWRRAVGLPSVL